MPEDIVRVLRIVEYTGPRSLVEDIVSRSIHGQLAPRASGKDFRTVVIKAATIGIYPEILDQSTEDDENVYGDKVVVENGPIIND